tara:strand:+ start:311 stop:646 length:336 start_codon:yes stop_codon:yes gene_type:complete
MGLFSAIIKGVVRGARGIGGKIVKGLKSAGEKVVKGVKGGISKVKQMFKKTPKKDWTEGDPVKFVDLPGQGKMAYKGGKPLTGKVIKGKGKYDDTFNYVGKLIDPDSIYEI